MAKKRNASPRRPPPTRFARTALLIVCEGLETEANYFKRLVQELKLKLVNIEIEPLGAAPITVVKRAKTLKEQRDKEVKRAKKRGDAFYEPKFDKVWCVFDMERIENNSSFYQAVNMAKDNGFFLAISNPSFELWYLLHFVESSRPFENAAAVLHSLKTHLPVYTKSLDVYPLVIGDRETALLRAEALLSDAEEGYLNPSTGVWRLVKELLDMRHEEEK